MGSKLFDLKEWVTVPDAAAYLSDAFGEIVTEADILRFTLDKHLTLSVYLPNGATVKRGKIVTHSLDKLIEAVANNEVPDDLNWVPVPRSFAQKGLEAIHDDSGEDVPFITSLRLSDSQWVTLNQNKVTSVWGLWDLPMIGGERLDIEHQYLSLTGGPSITAETMDGAFIWRGPNDICQIQADFDDNELQAGSKAQGLALENRIVEDGIENEIACELRGAFQIKRKEYKEERRKKEYHNNFYPHGGLPDDAVLVVRTAVLREFVLSVSEPSNKEVGTRERDTLYKIIIGLAIDGHGYDPKSKRSTVSRDVSAKLDELGIPVSDDTVRKYIKEAEQLLPSKPA